MPRLHCIDCHVPMSVSANNDKNAPTRCKLCQTKLDKLDRGPTVGEVLSDA